jgi:hypothetical protein
LYYGAEKSRTAEASAGHSRYAFNSSSPVSIPGIAEAILSNFINAFYISDDVN